MQSRADGKRMVHVVTGSRAEFGLLRPVMQAIAAHQGLSMRVLATGAHLLPPNTIDEVKAVFPIAATIPMQSPHQSGRVSDAEAIGRGIAGFAELFAHESPDIVLVLGDRIEAFAAATAAAVSGIRVAHMHGGDRAEGIADESLRHAITKLAHIHLPATQSSALRIIAMGEPPERVHIVGSPAMDGLADIPPLNENTYDELGSPQIVMLLHPVGDTVEAERERAAALIEIAGRCGAVLALFPNHDPGRKGVVRAIRSSGVKAIEHLPRDRFIGLLRRAKVLIGNSSAGLIEAAAVPIRCINIGTRQAGREMPEHVTDIPDWNYQTIEAVLDDALSAPPLHAIQDSHPYGDGRTGQRTASVLAEIDLATCRVAKRNVY